ncbi:MAG: class I SAM-dependent methyltransferase, partial [Flavobacteriaceae bacterium]
MNNSILHTRIQDYINEHLSIDILPILFKKPIFDNVSNNELVEQIQSKQKCKKKLPTWYGTEKIYYPNPLNIEQSSSEGTAKYKSELVCANSLVDLTGGYGVDSYYFSKKVKQVFHCEIDARLSKIASHNFSALGIFNVACKAVDGIAFIKEFHGQIDWLYIDPSRRDDEKRKMVRLSDCLPDVPSHLTALFKKSKNILIKTSPLLDLSIGIEDLKFVKEVHVIAVKNEVKELLWVLENGFNGLVVYKTINLLPTGNEVFDVLPSEEQAAFSNFSSPLTYLYEPNAAILKSGGFKTVGHHFGLFKLHPNTHLYTS